MNSRDLTIALLAILAVLVILPFLVMGGMMGPGMMSWRMGPQGWGGWSGGFGALFSLLFIGGVALIVAAIIRRGARPDDPATLLKLRLARGEISREQFEELKQALQ